MGGLIHTISGTVGEFGDDPLQANILGLEILQALDVVGPHATVLGLPAVPRRLVNLEVPADLGEVLTLVEQLLTLGDLPDGSAPSSPHRLLNIMLPEWR